MRPRPILTLAAFAALAAGCSVSSEGGSVGEQLGFATPAPDEFMIIARAPIEVPPDLSALPTPQPGAPSRLDPNPFAEAQQSLFGAPTAPAGPATPGAGETALLTAAGATGDQSAVRAELDPEDEPAGEREYGLTSIFGYKIPADLDEEDAAILQKPEENDRLRRAGAPTPAAPPYVEEDEGNGLQWSGGTTNRRRPL